MAIEHDSIIEHCKEKGFDRAGIIPVGPSMWGDFYREWIRKGYHGSMAWMERNVENRLDPGKSFPWARFILAAVKSYNPPRPDPDSIANLVAKFARGDDYHLVIGEKLAEIRTWIEKKTGKKAQSFVDSGPIIEREIAFRSGLGWIGKNTTLIVPGLGSYVFIGVVLIEAEISNTLYNNYKILDDENLLTKFSPGSNCGSCTRCIDACPTGALVNPYVIDTRRCLSYLSVEHKGAIPVELREHFKGVLFACDICQEVCPFNHKLPITTEISFHINQLLSELSIRDVLKMDMAQYHLSFKRSMLKRTKLKGLLRNASLYVGSTMLYDYVQELENLTQHPDTIVSDSAKWALSKLK